MAAKLRLVAMVEGVEVSDEVSFREPPESGKHRPWVISQYIDGELDKEDVEYDVNIENPNASRLVITAICGVPCRHVVVVMFGENPDVDRKMIEAYPALGATTDQSPSPPADKALSLQALAPLSGRQLRPQAARTGGFVPPMPKQLAAELPKQIIKICPGIKGVSNHPRELQFIADDEQQQHCPKCNQHLSWLLANGWLICPGLLGGGRAAGCKSGKDGNIPFRPLHPKHDRCASCHRLGIEQQAAAGGFKRCVGTQKGKRSPDCASGNDGQKLVRMNPATNDRCGSCERALRHVERRQTEPAVADRSDPPAPVAEIARPVLPPNMGKLCAAAFRDYLGSVEGAPKSGEFQLKDGTLVRFNAYSVTGGMVIFKVRDPGQDDEGKRLRSYSEVIPELAVRQTIAKQAADAATKAAIARQAAEKAAKEAFEAPIRDAIEAHLTANPTEQVGFVLEQPLELAATIDEVRVRVETKRDGAKHDFVFVSKVLEARRAAKSDGKGKGGGKSKKK